MRLNGLRLLGVRLLRGVSAPASASFVWPYAANADPFDGQGPAVSQITGFEGQPQWSAPFVVTSPLGPVSPTLISNPLGSSLFFVDGTIVGFLQNLGFGASVSVTVRASVSGFTEDRIFIVNWRDAGGDGGN